MDNALMPNTNYYNATYNAIGFFFKRAYYRVKRSTCYIKFRCFIYIYLVPMPI